ncbi:tRNA dihydrouridine synthase [Legionella worsleiensis]|nr:tRNA-dihydrouridine synthase family protein [Legionella worsleiensis]
MHPIITRPFKIGSLELPHRLIQGPLAGYSCAPFRTLFHRYVKPAYCVTEMCSAVDVLHKHSPHSRYLFRSPAEKILAYQISGTDPEIMAQAAVKLQGLGADLIDINCGCPKTKIRKKGAGSALLDTPELLVKIIQKIRDVLSIPLTVKIRIQGNEHDVMLAQQIEQAGADALIVHGRRWVDDYDIACNMNQIAQIKQNIKIPVIANGDISSPDSVEHALTVSGCDGLMIARAGTGRPWLFKELLEQCDLVIDFAERLEIFMEHVHGLKTLEDEFKAVLQSKSLIRYYFKDRLTPSLLNQFYQLNSLEKINDFLVRTEQKCI